MVVLLIVTIIIPGLISCNKSIDNSSENNATETAKNKKIAVAVVHASIVGISEALESYPDSAPGVQFIRTCIDSIRFCGDNSGYFYVYNYQCINIAPATRKDLQGNNLCNYRDLAGNYVIRLLAATAKYGEV